METYTDFGEELFNLGKERFLRKQTQEKLHETEIKRWEEQKRREYL